MSEVIVTRRAMLGAAPVALLAARRPIPERSVVLTFDDSVRSHLTYVAPLLKDLGFGATFFVTHRWMADKENFLDWEEIARLHAMGFEVGNHTWDHRDVSTPRGAARLAGQLALVENALAKVDVPRPVSFAWPANRFGPEAFRVLREAGYKLARHGSMPEGNDGPLFDPSRHHPLLIPTTGIARPDWTAEHFQEVIDRTIAGRAVVLQFHGVPDEAHPWVHTPPEKFEGYMRALKDGGYRVLALRDLESYLDRANPPVDPLRTQRHPAPKGDPPLPVEVEATQSEPDYWRSNMGRHGYSDAEAALVLPGASIGSAAVPRTRILPYPGGRHPRIGFLDGCIDPLRGTKASVFLPWDPASYVVVDLPEAIFSNLGLMFLAHTHVPTIWDERNVLIENTDWNREPDGGLRSTWRLPNDVSFGAAIAGAGDEISMELWVRNGTSAPLSKMRTQICIMLKGAAGFREQTNDNKTLEKPLAAARSEDGNRWIATSWERCGRVWGNRNCPCLHSDPVLPDCAPGETVRIRGRLWFHEGPELPSSR